MHFSGPEAARGKLYGQILELPGAATAWDACLVFDAEVRWAQNPASPTRWMHQLGAGPPDLHLDAKTLAGGVENLLGITSDMLLFAWRRRPAIAYNG